MAGSTTPEFYMAFGGRRLRYAHDIGRYLKQYLGDMERAYYDASVKAARRINKNAVQWMKANHPWNNVTGNAEKMLHGGVETDAKAMSFTFILAQGVDYGRWLELKHGGKWGILAKTMETYSPKLEAALHEEWERVRRDYTMR